MKTIIGFYYYMVAYTRSIFDLLGTRRDSGVLATKEDILRIMDRGDWQILLDLTHFRGIRRDLVEARKELFPSEAEFIENMVMDPKEFYSFENDVFPDPTLAFLARYARGVGVEIRAITRLSEETP